jgi:hypothetical protein
MGNPLPSTARHRVRSPGADFSMREPGWATLGRAPITLFDHDGNLVVILMKRSLAFEHGLRIMQAEVVFNGRFLTQEITGVQRCQT